MKRILLLFVILVAPYLGSSQDFIEQLNNSVERTDGGSGAIVEYHVYLTPTNVKVFYATEWETGAVKGNEGGSKYFELSRKSKGEKESLIIDIDAAAIIEVEVSEVKGKKKFKYKFYF